MSEQTGTWWIWKVFWILLIVTAIEVVLGIIKPSVLIDNSFLGTTLLNFVFIDFVNCHFLQINFFIVDS